RYSLTGDTLTVAGVDYADQGTFSCRAWTLLDAVEAEAQLRVVGEPPPPPKPQGGHGTLLWGPPKSSWGATAPFVVEEEEGIFAPGRFVERLTVPGEQPWAPLTLSPYGRYRFRVLAANAYGRGEPSAPSAPIST
ncbi:UNVERIFIED_CONTAM: Neuronal-glial cell adhesion molecule, partial [Eudyptes robustus]